MSTEEVKAAETLGLIQGLADVVKIQQSTFQTQQATYLEALQKTNQQLSSLSETVELLSKSVPKSTLSAGSGLRLPNVTLPEFTGKQNLDRFMAQMESLLLSSGVPLRFWLTYLKQQCQKDSRAFDALIAAEKEHSSILGSDPSKATDEEYESYYKACVTVLKAKRGIPQDQQIRELLSQYYIMKQHPRESVADFSHRFSEVQNELEKLIPGIHRTVDGNELELIHAFSIKLLPVISKEIVSREFTYKTLQELIVVATRYEQNILPGFKEMTLGNPLPDAIYTNTAQGGTRPRIKGSNASSNFSDGKFAGRKPAANTGNRFNDVKPRENPRSNEICFPYNKYSSARCQLPDGKCKNGRIHKCTVCHKPGCKALKHQSNQSPAQANFASSESIESVRNDKIDKILDILQTQIPSQNSTALSSHVGKVEQTIQPNLWGPTPAQSQGGVFCSPAVVQALPSQSQVTELNLANRHILWAPVTSVGVKLPLPLDSCCSLSLVSKTHAELVSQKCPNLCYKKLATPLPVSVASPDSQLHAVGIMQIPITWENSICSTFSMLVVPGLSWPILFGQNHLRQTKAITDHDGLIVHFNHPSMQFAIKCGDSNPLASFQNLSSQNSTQGSSGSATIACMLTSVPPPTQPREHIVLHRGFNLVTFCLVMASTLVGNPLFSTPLWLEGSSIFPGVNVVSGPIDLKSFASSPIHSQFPQFLLPSYNHPKCRPSQPLPDPDPEPTVSGILTSQDSLISQPFAPMIDYEQVHYTTVLVRSTQNKTVLPLNANLGVVRSRTSEDDLIWQDAADHTAEQLSDTWLNFVTSQPSWFACHTSPVQPNYAGCASCSWKLAQQKSEMARAGLDSSILSPFLPEPESDHPHAFPPTDSGGLEPHSEEYFNKLVQALELDSPIYSHVDPLIMEKFKALLHKYPEAFYLPGSQLGTMKGFYHNIDTGQSPPVYRLPYHKSPAELCAIKNELQKMLSQEIIKPSHSLWGAPCILVRKPPEKGIPQPPRLVVDYRGLNAVTSGDGYPIPSVSNILDALSGGNLFGKLDLASGYWQVLVNPEHKHKTAFSTHLGLYEFLRMPYGLKTAPHTFQRILNSVFSDFLYQWLIIYIDDCIIWSSDQNEALSQYEKVFERAVKFGLQFKPTKCFFFSENLEILGHRITPECRYPTQKGTEAISAMPRPHNVSSVKRFLGMVGYFRDYVKNMFTRTKHLCALLKKGTPFLWTSAHEAEFNDLKDALTSPDTMLFHPDWNGSFEVHTDASKHGCGAMLAQWHHGELRPVKFCSRSFNPTEARWPTTHQELYAVKWALEQNRPYLLGRQIKVITDHANLKWLTSISPQQSKLARWCISMAEFDFTLEHRPGKEHVVPDTLSRASPP